MNNNRDSILKFLSKVLSDNIIYEYSLSNTFVDLGFDSIKKFDFVMAFEYEYDITIEDHLIINCEYLEYFINIVELKLQELDR